MSWSTAKGFSFRLTSGYVTDGANDTYVLKTTSYPTTRTVGGESVTFGWESAPPFSGDRTTLYPKTSGHNALDVVGSGGDAVFRVDLPSAGDYRIRLALGDPANDGGYYSEIRDTSSVLLTLGSLTATTASGLTLVDAAGTARYASNWEANNTSVDETFSTSIFRVALIQQTALYSAVSYLQIEQLASAASRVNSLTGKLGFPMIGKL